MAPTDDPRVVELPPPPTDDSQTVDPEIGSNSGPPAIPRGEKIVALAGLMARPVWRHRRMVAVLVIALGLLSRVRMPDIAVPPIVPPPRGTVTVTAILPNGSAETSGTVLADGLAVGPPGVLISLPAGPVTLRYAAPGWFADGQRTTIEAGTNSAVRLRLKPMPARVSVESSPPAAEVSIDGRSYGRTPADLEVSAGQHELTVSLDGYAPGSIMLSVERGQERSVDLALAAIRSAPFDRGVTTGATSLRAAPSPDAETLETLDPGQELSIAGTVTVYGQDWLAARDSDGRNVYLPPDSPVVSWSQWRSIVAVSGTIAEVLRGYRFRVGTRTVTLYGIRPPDMSSLSPAASDAYDSSLRRLAARFTGAAVECEPHSVRLYTCSVEHRDAAEMFLLEGAAVADTDTTPRYMEMQQRAVEARRGWAQ